MDGETKRKVASIKFKPDHSLRINIRKSLLKRGGGFYEHTHDCTEVAIVTRGSATHIVNGRGHFVKSGDVYVIKPGVSHGFENADEMVHYVFSYMPEMLDAIGRDIRMTVGFQTLFAIGHGQGAAFDSMLRLSLESLAKLEALMDSMLEELTRKAPGYESVVKARFVEFVAVLSREYMNQAGGGGAPLDVERAAKLASRLETRYQEPPRLPKAARELGVSERQLRRIFLRHYGVSPLDYLMKVRARRAAELLSSGDKTLSEIAYLCGFSDANYMSRQFKKATGLTPSLWRGRRISRQFPENPNDIAKR